MIIANVTYQGIEEMTPVLHFAGQPKRLALTRPMAQQLTAATGTSLRAAWMGREILLQPQMGPEGPTIEILPAQGSRASTTIPPRLGPDEHGWRTALAIVLVVAIAGAVYTYVFLPQLQANLAELLRILE